MFCHALVLLCSWTFFEKNRFCGQAHGNMCTAHPQHARYTWGARYLIKNVSIFPELRVPLIHGCALYTEL